MPASQSLLAIYDNKKCSTWIESPETIAQNLVHTTDNMHASDTNFTRELGISKGVFDLALNLVAVFVLVFEIGQVNGPIFAIASLSDLAIHVGPLREI